MVSGSFSDEMRLSFKAEKQYSGVDFRDIVIDDRTSAPLSDFESIIHILRWRVSHQGDELAFSTIANKSKEGPGLSWKKFDRKVATVALVLKINWDYVLETTRF